MKTVKRIAALFALMLTTAVWADAPTPVAVWHGDLADGSTKGADNAFVMSKSSSDSVVVFENGVAKTTKTSASATQGVRVDWTSATETINAGQLTVFVKYSGLSYDNPNHALISLVTPSEGNEVVAYVGSNKTKIGLAHGATSNNGGTQGYGTPTVSLPEEGIMMLSIAHENSGAAAGVCGTRFAYAAKQSDGTYGSFTEGNYNSGIKWSSQKFYGVKVAGTVAPVGSYYRPTMTVDGIAIYNQATSIADAETMANGIFTAPEPVVTIPNPLYHFNFNGNINNSGTKAGFDWSGEKTENYTVGRDGALNSAYKTINGSAHPYGSIETPSTTAFVATAWLKSVSDQNAILYTIGGSTDHTCIGLKSSGANGVTVFTLPEDTANDLITAEVTNATDEFHHYALKVVGNEVTLYVDGVVKGTNTKTTAINGKLQIGGAHGGIANMSGVARVSNVIIDDFCIYNENLTDDQIKKLASTDGETIVSKTVELSGEKTWDSLEIGDAKEVTLNVVGVAELTLTKGLSDLTALKITGSENLTIKNAQHVLYSVFNASAYTGKLNLEFVIAGSNYVAGPALRTLIKTGGDKYNFIFKGAGSNGANIDYGDTNLTDNGPIFTTHVVFDGGTHTLKERHESSSAKFGANGSAENPTIWVKSGTLTFNARNICGWTSGASTTAGLIRVGDGATMNYNPVGGTAYWAQQIYLEPGSTFIFNDGSDNFRINGGQSAATAQIYVPDSSVDASNKPARIVQQNANGKIVANNQGTAGFAIYVGQNAVLDFDAKIDPASGATVKKFGSGTLLLKKPVTAGMTIDAGSVGGTATISSLTLNDGAGIVVNETDYLTISGTLNTQTNIPLVGALKHGMPVFKAPESYVTADHKATQGDGTYDIYLDEGVTRLKYKNPPTFVEGMEPVSVEIANGNGGKVEVSVSTINPGDYTGNMSYSLKFNETTVDGVLGENGKISFTLPSETFLPNTVYRGEFVVKYGEDGADGEISNPITVYEGEQTYKESQSIVIHKAATINDAAGETVLIKDKMTDPDYVDNCDSIYMVTLCASEAVDADADTELADDEQGGLRLVKNGDGTNVKLEYLYRDEETNTLKWGDQWPKGTDLQTVTLNLNESITVRVEFHYSKGIDADDVSYVKYSIGEDYATSVTSWSEKLKVTEVFISDGTVLPSDLTGLFQLDSAVVVDVQVELEPGHEDHVLDAATTKEEAEALAANIGIKVGDVVAAKLTPEQKNAYKGYFRVIAKQVGDHFQAEVVFTETTENELKEEIEKAVVAINTGSAEIAAKPGLYYGVKRGDTLDAMNTVETTMAMGDKVTITIVKPEESKSHFYRIIVSPTPAKTMAE